MAYSQTGGDGPQQFEIVSCGCQNGASINVGHQYILGCIAAGRTLEECGNELHDPGGDRVNKVLALVIAVSNMRVKGILPVQLPAGWP